MSTAQQLGLIGNSIKVQSLPTASAETFGAGNRFYTLIGQQEGYITGHTYHTVVANDVYSWEDVSSASIVDKIKTVSKAISELTDDELNILVSKKFLSAHMDIKAGDSLSPENVFIPTSKGRGIALHEPFSFSDSMTATLDALEVGYVSLGAYAGSGVYGSFGSKNWGYKSIVGTGTILTFNYIDD